ncbi:MAG TPA: SDR family NAD(P)-dependent oxidoreductase [Nevskia sp.]|nr:SDR family NAD(P)-dependent oxidoreductase [Nevskia sp.]
MTLEIEGGVAVVTGAASGIGSGLVRKALALGMRVVLADVQERALAEFAAGLRGEVLAVPTDVADAASVERLAQRAYEAYGRVDLLFNNAGVLTTGYVWEIEPALWKRSLDINLYGVLHGLRAFVPRMLRDGRPAHIVNTASIGGFLPSPLMAPYSASKFAVVALSESLRAELEMLKAPVGVSLLAPGPVKTGIFNDPFGGQANEAARAFVHNMSAMLEQHGLTPDQFAERVFAGVQAGQYWLIPQPEAFDELFRQRNEGILARANPRMPW